MFLKKNGQKLRLFLVLQEEQKSMKPTHLYRLPLQHGLIGAGAGTVNQGVARAPTSIPPTHLHRAPDEQLLERLAELARHSTVDGEVDGVGDDDEEVGEEDQHIGGVVVKDFGDGTGYHM